MTHPKSNTFPTKLRGAAPWLLGVALLATYLALRQGYANPFGLRPLDSDTHSDIGDALGPVSTFLAFLAFVMSLRSRSEDAAHQKDLLNAQTQLVNSVTKLTAIARAMTEHQERRLHFERADIISRAIHEEVERVSQETMRITELPGADIGDGLPKATTIVVSGLPRELFIPLEEQHKKQLDQRNAAAAFVRQKQRDYSAPEIHHCLEEFRHRAFEAARAMVATSEALHAYRFGSPPETEEDS